MADSQARRIRKMTEKAQEIYEKKVSEYYKTLSTIKSTVEESLKFIEQFKDDSTVMKEVRGLVQDGTKEYLESASDFRNYLIAQNTDDSNRELVAIDMLCCVLQDKVKVATRFIDEQLTEVKSEQVGHNEQENKSSHSSHMSQSSHRSHRSRDYERTSHKSHHESSSSHSDRSSHSSHISQSSHKNHRSRDYERTSHKSYHKSNASHSSRSSFSHASQSSHPSHSGSSRSILLDKKAKAEAAKARLKIIEEEERLIHEQNKLEIEVQKQRLHLESTLNILKHKKKWAAAEAELGAVKEILNNDVHFDEKLNYLDLPQIPPEDIVRNYVDNQTPQPINRTYILNPDVEEFVPRNTQQKENIDTRTRQFRKPTNSKSENPPTENNAAATSGISDLTKYLMKKEILLSRLSQFDDQPERYYRWKNSFINIMREYNTSVAEELDLLNRWLGPKSRKQAESLCDANAHDEAKGLKEIWKRLDQRYGAPESIAASLQNRLNKFPKVNYNEYDKLYDLADLLSEIESVKQNERYKMVLAYFDSSYGVNQIVGKLPNFMQTKWVDQASRYKSQQAVMYPPFKIFVEFVNNMAVRMNDPSFKFQQAETGLTTNRKDNRKFSNKPQSMASAANRPILSTRKTTVENSNSTVVKCPLHEDGKHNLVDCRLFLSKSLEEKREIVKKHGVCFKCLSAKHLAKDCQASIKCGKCGNSAHCTTFHIERSQTLLDHGGESNNAKKCTQVDSKCTEICNDSSEAMYLYGKSCAKTILVNVYPKGKPEEKIRTYAIIDDQSNRSLARSEFFDHFNEKSDTIEYTLASCSGKNTQSGRRATGYVLESIDETVQLDCPCLIECNQIPNSKQEVATPAVARHYRHLQDLEQYIPKYDTDSDTLLLIGRDLIAAHHVLDHRIGKDNEPYAQRLRLGWTIIGETCLGLVHSSDRITVNKTFILPNGRQSHLKPCEYGFKVKETKELNIGSNIFLQTTEDDTPGLSQEDRQFLKIMDSGFEKASDGNLSAPLPFRKDRPKLPNNYHQARHRAENLAKSLKRDPVKLKHFTEFMNKIFSSNHAEEAPPVKQGEVWYLPIFGVYHPKKPLKIRVVFDSSAKHDGICLNDVLLKGPDLTNNLVGVLLKFRKGRIAAIADVEQMFFNFEVNEEHRDYLRFIWFKDNDIEKPLVEYRMRVHVFGNSPSPSVANYGLRKAVCNHEGKSCDDVCQFVKENFYVDDALVSEENTKDIVNLIKETQDRLMEGGNIRLHKIVSNNTEVVSSFSKNDLAEGITEVDFESESSCLQRSLGISWDVVRDIFTYQVSTNEKPYTKRGLLSVINGVFDPLGFAAPVILGGRLIMRQAVQNNAIDWDDQLPDNMRSEWIKWSQSLKDLELLQISRPFTGLSLGNCSRCELHIFSDASKDAIASVAYIRTYGENGDSQIGFVLGKSKLAPSHGHTIPRLELCAAVLSTELATFIQKQLKIPTNSTYFYTDSQVVLGYIHNEERRFFVYVSNRVDKILKASTKLQWNYVPTEFNPADHGTRPLEAKNLGESEWLKGPSSFFNSCNELESSTFEVVTLEDDKEVRPFVEVMKTSINPESLGTSRFERFSSWSRLVKAISNLKQRASFYHKPEKDLKDTRNDIDFLEESELLILKEAQMETYSNEIACLQHNKQLPKDSSLISLAPILDSNGLLRLGGRLKNAKLTSGEKMPIIISGRSYIAALIVRHFHQLVHHQGRHYTEGAIRSNGIWLTGGKRLINSILQKCVKCRMLRGKVEQQKMADLPADRLTPTPPFTYVGVDTFGPWSIATRRTRGGVANAKRWAIMFSCLVTRAIHIEIVEEMTSSSFINALRRFTALRGPVKEFRSDQGTNFIGAVNELGLNCVNVEDQNIKNFLDINKSIWKFNPPYASHMNGAWERMIGLARRILDSMLSNVHGKQLTHEVLCTLMAEVCCIVNSRPIIAVSSDPESPTVLSPNTLLTQKINSDIELFPDLSIKDMYKAQWKHVQVLAGQFWKQWRSQYLNNLQLRKIWPVECRNIQTGDLILMVDDTLPRNQWQKGTVDSVFPSSDGLVRKVSVRVIRNGEPVTYIRPITKLVHLMSD